MHGIFRGEVAMVSTNWLHFATARLTPRAGRRENVVLRHFGRRSKSDQFRERHVARDI